MLYLWHWPMLVVGSAMLGVVGVPSPALALLLLAVSLTLSAATHHLVEQPLRRAAHRRPALRLHAAIRPAIRPARPGWALLSGAVAATAVAVLGAGPLDAFATPAPHGRSPYAVAAVTYQPASLGSALAIATAASRFPDLHPSLGELPAAGAPEWLVDGCADTDASNVAACRYGTGRRGVVAVLGDSLADSWVPGLRAALEPAGWQVQLLTRTRCPAPHLEAPHGGDTGRAPCAEHQASALEQVRALHPVAVLVTDSPLHLTCYGGPDASTDTRWAAWRAGTSRTLLDLAPLTDRVVLVGAPPGSGNLQACTGAFTSPSRCAGAVTPAWSALRRAEAGGLADAAFGASYVDVEGWFQMS